MSNKMKNINGFTLLEVLVAAGIMSIIVIVAGNFIAMGMDSLRFDREFHDAVSSGRRSMETVSKEIRSANNSERGDYPIALASDQEFIFYSDVDYDGSYDRVRYYIVDRSLYKAVTLPGPGRDYAGGETAVKLADYVNNGGQEIFTYYDSNSNETTDIDDIRMINIRLLFNVSPGMSPDDIIVETDVQLRNLKSNL